MLSFPPGRPLLRREAPLSRGRPQAPRALPASPADIASFIRDVGAPEPAEARVRTSGLRVPWVGQAG